MSESENTPEASKNALPVFPAPAPPIFTNGPIATALFDKVLTQLANVIDIPPSRWDEPTPCKGFSVQELRLHVLGWLEFFAAALNDPSGSTPRPDPDARVLNDDELASDSVRAAACQFARAISEVPEGELVTMAQARMSKEAVLAMALGEYLVHGWDLHVATDVPWEPVDTAAGPALEFLNMTVAPEHRGADSGFFDAEIDPPPTATDFERLLCFSGRDPNWTAQSPV